MGLGVSSETYLQLGLVGLFFEIKPSCRGSIIETISHRRRLSMTLLAGAIGEIVNKIAPFIVLYIGQTALGVTRFGMVQFAISFIDLLLPFIGYGYGAFGSIAVGRPASLPIPIPRLIPSIVLLRLAHAAVACIVIGLCLTLPRYREYGPLILALSFLLLSSALDTDHVHSGTQTLAIRNAFNVVSKCLCLFGVMAFVHGPADQLLYAILAVMPNALIALLSLFYSMRKIPWSMPRLTDFSAIFRLATPFAMTTILGLVIERYDVFFVEVIGGSVAVGLYAGPLRIVQSIATAAGMVSAIFFSELVRIEDPKVFSRHVELSVFTAALELVPVAVGAWFVGGDLLAAVFTSAYRDQGPIPGYVLGILATGVVASIGINAFGLQVLWLKGANSTLNALYLCGLIGGCILSGLSGYWGGVIGVAASVTIVKFCVAGACYIKARQYLPSFSWLFLQRIVGASGAMGITLFLLKKFGVTGFFKWDSVWLRITMGAAVYTVAAALLFRRELPGLLRSFRKGNV